MRGPFGSERTAGGCPGPGLSLGGVSGLPFTLPALGGDLRAWCPGGSSKVVPVWPLEQTRNQPVGL